MEKEVWIMLLFGLAKSNPILKYLLYLDYFQFICMYFQLMLIIQ